MCAVCFRVRVRACVRACVRECVRAALDNVTRIFASARAHSTVAATTTTTTISSSNNNNTARRHHQQLSRDRDQHLRRTHTHTQTHTRSLRQRTHTHTHRYGGHYLPTLAKVLVDQADVPNFKGFIVGNPLTYMEYRNYGSWTFARIEALFGRLVWLFF